MVRCVVLYTSGRFLKQEQWERWRAKRKLMSRSKHRGRELLRGFSTMEQRSHAFPLEMTPVGHTSEYRLTICKQTLEMNEVHF